MEGTRGAAGAGIRANATRFHITYAACERGEIDHPYMKARIDEFAIAHGGLKEWSIGIEEHKEAADPQRDEHLHVYSC